MFLRGMKHIQPEPSYGGPSDSAATLRATCALALVQCRSLPEADLLSASDRDCWEIKTSQSAQK